MAQTPQPQPAGPLAQSVSTAIFPTHPPTGHTTREGHKGPVLGALVWPLAWLPVCPVCARQCQRVRTRQCLLRDGGGVGASTEAQARAAGLVRPGPRAGRLRGAWPNAQG